MNNHTKRFIKWALAAACLAPVLGWTHGAVDTPVSRQVHCYTLPNFWSGTNNEACKAVHAMSSTYPGQQWNEVAKLIKDYGNQAAVEAAIPDGQLCAAGDPLKAGLNLPHAAWDKTTVTPKGEDNVIDVRLIGTAPHVASFVKIYLSKPGYSAATTPLKWSDLELVHEERMTKAETDWGSNPPKISGASGYFKFKVKIRPERSGDAVLFTRWQREDSAGEGFYNCSDITIAGSSVPEGPYNIGPFIGEEMKVLKTGDSVRFRIFDNKGSHAELVDIIHKINKANLPPGLWGEELAQKVDAAIAKIGEQHGQDIVFNPINALGNNVFVTQKGYTKAMSIIPGGGDNPGPVNPAPPVARITGPATLNSGQAFTFSGTGSTGSNGPLLYEWAVPGMTDVQNASTIGGSALEVTETTKFTARLNVRDPQNGKAAQAALDFTVKPAGNGGEYPAWVKDGGYNSGSKVSNYGLKFVCIEGAAGAWCGQNENEPGKPGSTYWQRAWTPVP